MEPFTIICETCAARLKVRRASMINQVLACPKCTNMVRVVAPEGLNLEDETVPSLPPQVKKNPENKPSGKSQEAFTNFDDVDDLIAREQSVPSSPQIPKPTRRPNRAKAKANPTNSKQTSSKDDGPLLPDQSWASTQSRQRQKMVMAIGGGIAIILITIAGITAFVVNSGKTEVSQSDAAKETTPLESDDETRDKNEDSSESKEPDAVPNNDSDNQDQTPLAGDQATPNTNDTTTSPNDTTTDATTPTPLVQDTANSAKRDPETPLIENPLPQENELEDPLGTLNLGPGNDPILGSSLDDATEISTQLGELNALLQTGGMTLTSIQNLADSNRRKGNGIPKYFVARPDPSSPDLLQILSTPISGVQYQQIPLITFLREFSHLVGAPLPLHIDSLQAANIDWNQKVDKTLTDLPLSEVIDNCLETFQLERNMLDTGQIVILAKGWNDMVEKSHQPHRLSDNSPTGQANFVRQVRNMFADGAWTDQTVIEMRNGELFVKQVPQVQYQIDRLLDKLKAVQLLNENTNDETVLNTLKTEWKKSETARTTELKFKPRPDLEIGRFVKQIEAQAGITVLIDWFSLSKQGWSPKTLVPGDFDEPDVQTTLTQLARAMGCTFRVIDATTFELLTVKEADIRPELQVYPTKDIVSGPIKSDSLMEILGRTFQRDANLVQAGFDLDTQSVVVIAPQDIQVQIEAVIDRIRKSK